MKGVGDQRLLTRTELGAAKELLAADYLRSQGLRLLASNHRCRYGEIDLVMADGDILVFVEVRFRASSHFGSPAETVDLHKQRRLCATANHYLRRYSRMPVCRFDVVAITGRDQIHWMKNAFDAQF